MLQRFPTEKLNIIFKEVMNNGCLGISVKDRRWLDACMSNKWPQLSGVNFEDRSFLDVGCHVGYSCIEAWNRGARPILGIDIRSEVINIARTIKEKLDIPDNDMQFMVGDWIDIKVENKFEIVSCMGLLHYWLPSIYKKALIKLASICLDTLILELRVRNTFPARLNVSGIQSIPTRQWLFNAIRAVGFKPFHCEVQEPNRRELWISRRVKCQSQS